MPASQPTVVIDTERTGQGVTAQIVRYDIPGPTNAVIYEADRYLINMCLTPRPLNSRAGYRERWGPHRFERLGDVFMVPPGEALAVRGEGGQQASLLCYLGAGRIDQLLGQRLEWSDRQLATTLDITNARIRNLLFRLTEEVRHPGFAAGPMLEFLSGELAVELGRFCLEVEETPVTGGLASWRLRLIDERLAASPAAPALEDLAALCNLSVRQLTRGFRISRGCSIGEHIERRQMESAKRMLVAGDSVKAIAFALGFSSPSSFAFAFRRAVGTSPSTFRQRQLRSLTG
ncbi:AraC family transcriptional regulator [Novosphingobium sp. TH158]|uniref:helix-turn-helix domain-containing protein n=1 Tax=Novosphingobium sp. TH158 TaxID=2067455 RepID=UPI000C796740|nr:helix-turn-helix transcriptional regulator [Novosphingobium sp. TH158]PLK26191.1 AraC family transcriptional regulator [Novosphingobium sp. TH158]